MSKTFDTLQATRHLKAAGVASPHAEAFVDVVRNSRDELATEAGLESVRGELAIIRWLIGMMAAMVMGILVVMLTHTF